MQYENSKLNCARKIVKGYKTFALKKNICCRNVMKSEKTTTTTTKILSIEVKSILI